MVESARIVHSIVVCQAGGRRELFEYVVGRDVCTWYRRDPDGRRAAADRPCSSAQVAGALDWLGPEIVMREMRVAAEALDRAQADLLERSDVDGDSTPADVWMARRAMHLRRERLALLARVLEAADRLGREAEDPTAARAAEMASDQVESLIARDFPDRMPTLPERAAMFTARETALSVR